jgi:cytochrome b involved in lipid metabolism
MKKYWWILIVIFILAGVFIISLNLPDTSSSQKQSPTLVSANSSPQNLEPPINTDSSKGITLQNLSKHNSKSDCWIVYNNQVYDITSYLPRHPGGPSTITPTCGNTKFDSAFQGYHGTSYESRLLNAAVYIGAFSG